MPVEHKNSCLSLFLYKSARRFLLAICRPGKKIEGAKGEAKRGNHDDKRNHPAYGLHKSGPLSEFPSNENFVQNS
jgi:hypothetical protein